jgi:hypothetical protein
MKISDPKNLNFHNILGGRNTNSKDIPVETPKYATSYMFPVMKQTGLCKYVL